MNKTKRTILIIICAITCILTLLQCWGDGTTTNDSNNSDTNINLPINPPLPTSDSLNLSVFVDLSDRIKKDKDGMTQAEKDTRIINGLIDDFIAKNTKGFAKSEDCFRVVFYPAPAGSDVLAENLCLDLGGIKKGIEKKNALLNFMNNHSSNLEKLYEKAMGAEKFWGSDIWGFFAKDKVNDLYKPGYRNVLVILSDGYVYDVNVKVRDGNNYSYILPQTLAIKNSGLIPCKISNPDIEIYFIECNANPQTDYPKMKAVLENWFKDMGVIKIDIQDTDLPANIKKHLQQAIFNKNRNMNHLKAK